MPKVLIDKIKNFRKNRKKKTLKKRLRKGFKKIFSKKNLTRLVIIFSGLALIASFTLPYIL